MHNSPKSLELDFSKLLGFEQLPRASMTDAKVGEAALLTNGALQSKVGGKPINMTMLGSKVGIKA